VRKEAVSRQLSAISFLGFASGEAAKLLADS
jgi:hypothetical protein